MTLQRLSAELDRFFTLSLDLLCIADMQGRFVRLNRAWETVLGYPLHELEGREYLNYYPQVSALPARIFFKLPILLKIPCLHSGR
ncbi:MAG: PAS domain S-box protein [Magnetococcus sp. YQC-9]